MRPLPSSIMVETELANYSHGALNPDRLARMPVAEVFDRLSAAKRVEAEQRRFAVEAASVAHMDKKGQAAVWRRLDGLARAEVRRRPAFELLPDHRRIEYIGGYLDRHGERWAARHPDMMRWLSAAGVSENQAIERSGRGHERDMRDNPVVKRRLARIAAQREHQRRAARKAVP